MEWNPESVLDALNDFERKPDISPILDEYLQRVAKNGEIIFPWSKLKPLLKKKLEVVLDEFYETCPVETSVPVPNFETFNFDNLKKSILQAVDAFTSAPFTIQRLCELVTNPQKHYNRTDKYMRGIEKNVLVVSTIEPRTGGQGDINSANNNVIVNGMINDSPKEESDTLNGHESESSDSVSSSNLDTTPSNHVLLENFANVFPSAACIPSASNICIKREIDSNFISTSSECTVESQDNVDFESNASEPPVSEDSTKVKDEPMDTSEESTSSVASEDSKMSTDEVSESSEVFIKAEDDDDCVPEKKKLKLEEEPSSDDKVSSNSEVVESNNVSDDESINNEVSCSEVSKSPPQMSEEENLSSTEQAIKIEETDSTSDNVDQQDSTITQSDNINSSNSDDTAKSNNALNVDKEAMISDKLSEDSDIKTESTEK